MAEEFDPENYVPVRSARTVMPMQVKGSLWQQNVAPTLIWILLAFALLPAAGAMAGFLPGVDSLQVGEVATALFGMGLMAAVAYFAVSLLGRGRTSLALATAGGLAASALVLFTLT
jgi:hypothetical protein